MDTPRRFRLFRAPTTTRDKENSGIKSTTAITTGKNTHSCINVYLSVCSLFICLNSICDMNGDYRLKSRSITSSRQPEDHPEHIYIFIYNVIYNIYTHK